MSSYDELLIYMKQLERRLAKLERQEIGASVAGGDHGTLSGLGDDDHTQYLLAAAYGGRTAFGTNWTDLTDGGTTTLHRHDIYAALATANVFTAKQTFPSVAGVVQSGVADDAAFSIVTPANYGILFLMAANLNTIAGAAFFRCQSGFAAQCALIASGPSTIVATTTDTVLAGTTGTDGKVTISPHATNGLIYIENRSGGTRNFSYFFIAQP